VLAFKVLVGELLAVDGFTPGALGDGVRDSVDFQSWDRTLTLPRVKSPP